ncbi:MAG: AraC family transcriptional regulator [Acidobacteriota bacterium]
MLLDRLLAKLDVEVEPFALCLVSSGWRLRLPGPPAVMLHFVLAGRGILQASDGGERPLVPGTLAVIPKGSPHAIGPQGEALREHQPGADQEEVRVIAAGEPGEAALTVACGLVRVRYGSALGLFDQLERPLVEDLSAMPRARPLFEDLLAEQREPGPGSGVMQTALMSQALVLLLRRLCQQGECGLPWIAGLQDPRLARVLERILEDPARPFTVESLASEAAMSRSAFAEGFTVAFGLPPMALVQRVRLERARQLLERGSALSMDAVARRVGYASRSHFSRSFRKQYGMAPNALRALSGNFG